MALSSASATAASASATLKFGSVLEAEMASDASHYTAQINGRVVGVESAAYNEGAHSVMLGLPNGALHCGDRVVVRWSGLLDVQGRTLSGPVGPLTAR